jgi:UDP-2,4-diacetamido-2,4,6-trideoxy-beta-L-altropyranose hydrolase
MTGTSPRVIFCAAAGPHIGFGHLVRCRSLARALGIEPVVVVRGSSRTRAVADASGWKTIAAGDVESMQPHVLVVDDPSACHAARWVEHGRRVGARVAAVHDLGLGYVPSDLGIDASLHARVEMHGRFGDLRGPRYAILDPRLVGFIDGMEQRCDRRVLIALGGGSHVERHAAALTAAIAARVPSALIRVAAGFSARRRDELPAGEWISAPDGLAEELSRAAVAVVAGGVTLFEACALGVPTVAFAVTAAQHATIANVVQAAAAIDGGMPSLGDARIDGAAASVATLIKSRRLRRHLADAARRLVDGRGAFRVADALRQLALSWETDIHVA